MRITSEDQITFENPSQDGRNHWQDIVFNGEIIGALCQLETNMLTPIKDRYQLLVDESEIGNPLIKNWYESEDEGKIFAYFLKLKWFIEYYNSKIK